MTQINHQQPNHVTPQHSSSHSKQQSSPMGTELGQDTISLSKEFAKGTSSKYISVSFKYTNFVLSGDQAVKTPSTAYS